MAENTLTFSCVDGVCTPGNLDEQVQDGDTLKFQNNISTGTVDLSQFNSSLFSDNSTYFSIPASGSVTKTIASNAEPNDYTYTITCTVCPPGNDQGTISVIKN